MDIDFEALKQPISEADPCGPDLDMEDDDEFLMFDSDMEAKVPARFADFFQLKTENPNLDPDIRRCLDLLERSRDLRLCVWLAKLVALQGDVDQLTEAVGLIKSLLQERWEEVNPRALDGDLEGRMNALQRLDERASVELPLQYLPIVRDMAGTLRFRDQMVAAGEVEAREGERLRDAGQIETILGKAAIENIIAGRDGVAALRGDLTAIRSLWIERDGYDNAIKFEQVPAVLDRMFAFLDEAVARRDPDLAAGAQAPADEPGDGEAPEVADDGTAAAVAVPTGKVASTVAAKAALGAVADYFREHEPSSPARLLVNQAQSVVGLSFAEVLQRLAPDLLSEAVVKLRGASAFTLSVETLGERTGETEEADPEEPDETFAVENRASAAALIREVVAWYKGAEPSSPIPMLLERARELMAKDFSALLTELVPKPDG